jgi:hypothetical protein
MRVTRYLVTSVVLFLLGIGCLAEGVAPNSTASVNVAYPLSGNEIRFCGASTGGWAVAGVFATIAGTVFLVLTLIRSIARDDSSKAT